jgi:hypothetical protein
VKPKRSHIGGAVGSSAISQWRVSETIARPSSG